MVNQIGENKMIRKRIRLAQNFFRDQSLVASIIKDSSVGREDTVYEVGPGEGIITTELAKVAGKVVTIEKDNTLAAKLKEKFRNVTNIKVIEGDFLGYKISEINYKIFANIPFNITAEIVKRILFGKNPPKEAYLVVQKEAAEKFSGIPHETEVSMLAKPWFELKIVREFRRTDFEPVPSMDVVLIHIARRARPLISEENTWKYQQFIRFGFTAWRKDLKIAYKRVFSYEQWKRLSKNLHFSLKAVPTDLTFEQWLGLFKYFLVGVIDSKKSVVLNF